MRPGKPSTRSERPPRRPARTRPSRRSACDGGRGVVRRFVVAETSMLPSLQPGDGLIAVRMRRIRRGEIRVFEHPQRAGFWLVKRVGHVRGRYFEALSDNPADGAVDSATFGDVEIDGSYRVLLRLPMRSRTD